MSTGTGPETSQGDGGRAAVPSRSLRWKLSAVAAGLIVVATGLTFLALRSPGGGETHVIQLPGGARYEIQPMMFDRPVTRQAAGMDKQWEEAGAAYQTGNYRKSERLFGQIERAERRDPERHDATLYRGVSLLMAGRHQEAEEVLRRARGLAQETGLAGSADSFYLGVAAIARNDRARAVEALRQAVGGPFDKDARALLAEVAGR